MPYPLHDERDKLLDLMEPRERMLFELLENQMKQTQLVMQTLITTRWWAVSSTTALMICLIVYTIALIFK